MSSKIHGSGVLQFASKSFKIKHFGENWKNRCFQVFILSLSTDLLGPVAPRLFETGMKTVILGIGSSFVPIYLQDIVESPDDIFQVETFQDLSLFYDNIGEYVCEANITGIK